MNVYLLRHGQAENSAPSDSLRQLTSQGVEDIKSVAKTFAPTNHYFDRCFVSPYIRAQQTAELFLKDSNSSCILESEDILRPDNSVMNAVRFIEAIDGGNILLVGHNPFLSKLYTLFTTAQNDNGMKIIAPGELCGISFEVFGLGIGSDMLNILPHQN